MLDNFILKLQRGFGVYRDSFSGLSRDTWLLSAVILINRSTYMAIPFMSLYITLYLHRPATDTGIIFTLFGVGSVIGSFIGGKLSDLIGFHTVQVLSISIGGLLFIFYPLVTNFTALSVLIFTIAVFAEAFRPANFTAVAAYATEDTTTRAYSLNRMASNIGWALGSALGGIIAAFSYPWLFRIDGGTSIFAGLLIIIFLKPVKAKKAKESTTAPLTGGLKPWKDSHYVKFILLTTVFYICFYLFFRIMPLFFKQQWQLNESIIGLIIGLNGLYIAVFEMLLVNAFVKKRSSLFYIKLGANFTAFSFILLLIPLRSCAPYAILFISIFTFGEMLSMPFIDSYASSLSDKKYRGMYAAGYAMCFSVAQLIGPAGGFYFVQRFGYNALWLVMIFLLSCCAIGYKLLEKRYEI
jgi:predicted MFS family arabinose efflux permease